MKGDRLYICGTNAHNPKDYVIYVSILNMVPTSSTNIKSLTFLKVCCSVWYFYKKKIYDKYDILIYFVVVENNQNMLLTNILRMLVSLQFGVFVNISLESWKALKESPLYCPIGVSPISCILGLLRLASCIKC